MREPLVTHTSIVTNERNRRELWDNIVSEGKYSTLNADQQVVLRRECAVRWSLDDHSDLEKYDLYDKFMTLRSLLK